MTVAALSGAVVAMPSRRRLIVAATIGNVFEWFDFVVYGFFAVPIAEAFFPHGNPTVSLLITFGAFGLAYLMRPLGAIVIGGYTDRAGRKAGLMLSIALMMIGTTMMAVTPAYATIGLAAPILLTVARLLQGFSVGGEFGSAVTFLAEHGGERRGFSASWQFATGGMITVLVSLFGLALTTLFTHQQLVDWGWRIPYVFGMLVGPAGLYIRAKVVETPEFLEAEKPDHHADQRPLAPASAAGAAGIGRVDHLQQLVLPLALHPDLRGQDPAPAGLYRLCRDPRRRRRSWRSAARSPATGPTRPRGGR